MRLSASVLERQFEEVQGALLLRADPGASFTSATASGHVVLLASNATINDIRMALEQAGAEFIE